MSPQARRASREADEALCSSVEIVAARIISETGIITGTDRPMKDSLHGVEPSWRHDILPTVLSRDESLHRVLVMREHSPGSRFQEGGGGDRSSTPRAEDGGDRADDVY